MASRIKIPLKELTYYKVHEKPLVKDKLAAIYKAYGKFIKVASRLCNVPSEVIASFIFIESAGRPDVVSRTGAVGLMQVTPASAGDMISLENKTGSLSQEEKVFLKRFLGPRLDCILAMKHMGHKLSCNNMTGVSIKKEDLLVPEFNIFCGALFLSILMRLHNENGEIRMDKVVVRYNRGYFVKPKGTTKELIASSPKETRDYIAKLLGVNSPMDILTAPTA